MSWQKLKELIQSISYSDFEKLVARLLELHLEVPFFVARSGDQPSGDARDQAGKISMQAKRYTTTQLNESAIVGEIYRTREALPDLQVYVLVVSRDIASQQRDRFDDVEEDTGIDIVILDLTDKLSELGALCVTFWEDIYSFFDLSDTDPEFPAWVQMVRDDSKIEAKIKELQLKLEQGIQTQKHVQEDVKKYLLERFGRNEGFNPINLSKGIERPDLDSEILAWWENQAQPVCCLEGEEGNGKTWLAAKSLNSISEKDNIVTFWLDSRDWKGNKSIFDLLYTCFSLIYPSYEQGKITKLQNKPAKIWRKTLIVLDGVNERKAIETAQRILGEYFRSKNEWRDRIRFLLTTRPLDNYPDFESNFWNGCHKISVIPFNDSELQKALTQKGLQSNDLPDSLTDIARIPRYFQRCLELRDELGSFDVVTKEMVLLADLLDKIEHSDPQIRETLGWSRTEDPKEFFLHLAQQMDWDKIDAAPERLGQSVKSCFSNYSKIRQDLEEQRIVRKAGLFNAELNDDYVLLCWALYLSNLFDCTEFTGIKEFAQNFQNVLEPIPAEYLRTEGLFLALQISAISPDPDISQDQLSQKRAALMLAWSNSHNASVTDDRLSYWTEKDSDAYAQIVEFEFENHNVPKYEEMLIEPLARAWLNKKGQIDRLASRLKKWLLPTYSVNSPENRDYEDFEGHQIPIQKYDPQVQLSAAALSILSQRPESQFLETLARCYETLERYESPDKNIGVLMRWGYTENVLENLRSLAERAQADDESLLKGLHGLAANLGTVDLPPPLHRPFSKKDKEIRANIEQWNRSTPINRIRNQEQLLTGNSPADNVEGNYHGLDYLAVRTDLPDLCDKDQVEIKKILHYISANTEFSRGPIVTFEESCVQSLIPWAAKHSPKDYAELACSLTLNNLDYGHPYYRFLLIQGLILKSDECEEITEAILGMKQCLAQWNGSLPNASVIASLLTEVLLFSASEDKLVEWFEFLASLEPLRRAIIFFPIPSLLRKLLSKSIIRLTRQKLEIHEPMSSDNRPPSDNKPEKLSEREYWSTLYAYGIQTDENAVTWALEELKLRTPNLISSFSLIRLVLSDPKRFLNEILNDKKVRRHLFCKGSVKLTISIYKGKDVPSYEMLISLLPLEIAGSFLCQPDRRSDLSRWGKELMERMFSILQGDGVNRNYVEELRFAVNQEVLKIWAEQNEPTFLQLADKYLSESPQYHQVLKIFTDDILCLLLRFQPDKAIRYYRQWKSEGSRMVDSTNYGVDTFLARLWKVEDCNSCEHRDLRCKLLEECLNDEDIMFMTLAALAGGGKEELWNLVTKKYLESNYAKERNLGVSILPWFGNDKAIEKLNQLKSEDPNRWVRKHAAWASEVAQQERSCREVYRETLQTRDLSQISAVFEQMRPALTPTARWWHRKIEDGEMLYAESQDSDPKLLALVERFWYRWENSSKTKRNLEVFGRKLREYCRGEKLPTIGVPRIAPWWQPASDYDSL